DYGATWSQETSDTTRGWRSVSISSDGKYQTAVASNSYIYGSTADSYIASGNVGIGTDSPSAKLTVTQSGTGDILNIFDGSTEVFTILDGGNVGIGTTTPIEKLQVNGDARIDGILKLNPKQITNVLEASDAADSDYFGSSVALSSDGSVLAVGAYEWEGATGSGTGGVYLYDWSGSVWIQRGSVLEASDAANSDSFGISVSLSSDGSILAVGAYEWEGATGSGTGGVYLYDWSGSVWIQRGSVLEASDATNDDRFGSSVALSSDGSVLAVGAFYWEGATGANTGGVYLYDWSGSWTQRGSVLEASDATDSDYFGSSVALSSDGSILAVGATGWEGATGTNIGGVYIYDWSSVWTQRGSVLEASDATDSDYFGSSVALSSDGSILAVGAYVWEGVTGSNTGGVYLYDWGSAWTQRGSVLEASDATDSDYFGKSVALSSDGSVLVVGASSWEGATGSNTGGVYSYSLEANANPRSRLADGSGWSSYIANTLSANTGGVERLRIDASGNIGIGTTSLTDKLTVRSDSTGAITSLLRIENLGTAAVDTGSSINFYANRTTGGSTKFASIESVVTGIGDTTYSGKLNLKVAINGALETVMELNDSNIVINRPLQVNVPGNTGMSYDLNFLNTGLTQITSEGPLLISAGDSNHYENLTLTTGNTGDIIIDIVDSLIGLKTLGSADGGYIMKLSPSGNMDLSQDLTLTGGILTIAELSASDLGTPALTENADQGSVNDDGCNDATAYYYKVTALNGNGQTTGSTEATITTGVASGTYTNDDTITVSWLPVHGATFYKVYRSINQDWTDADNYLVDNTSTSAGTSMLIDNCHGDAAVNPPTTNSTGGRIGINIADATPDRRLEVLDADTDNPQMRLTQSDAINYADFEVDATGDLTITMSDDSLIINDNLLVQGGKAEVCAGACPTTDSYNPDATAGDLGVEGAVIAEEYRGHCATGYIWVPGSAKFGTMPGFCVMKYEAKGSTGSVVSTATGLPYVSISQENARAECQGIGTDYHLISEAEWMTIAENIVNTTINDLDSDAGLQFATGHSDSADAGGTANTVATIDSADPIISGCSLTSDMENALNAYVAGSCEIRGDSSNGVDPGDANDKGFYDTGQDWADGTYVSGAANKAQLRTYILSNGEIIWDIAGNAWEWTDKIAVCTEHPEQIASAASEWLEYNDATGIDYKGFPYLRLADDGWSSSNGVGKIYTNVGGTANATRAFRRGGCWDASADAGVFSLMLNIAPDTSANTRLGFRCAR
ncbi:MAG: hypothetical protein KAI71_03550, partial [Candidatus Pacebacteria bacterium]|nr:hypothetical protein [Candidatus Paceibacterota bacterium]